MIVEGDLMSNASRRPGRPVSARDGVTPASQTSRTSRPHTRKPAVVMEAVRVGPQRPGWIRPADWERMSWYARGKASPDVVEVRVRVLPRERKAPARCVPIGEGPTPLPEGWTLAELREGQRVYGGWLRSGCEGPCPEAARDAFLAYRRYLNARRRDRLMAERPPVPAPAPEPPRVQVPRIQTSPTIERARELQEARYSLEEAAQAMGIKVASLRRQLERAKDKGGPKILAGLLGRPLAAVAS